MWQMSYDFEVNMKFCAEPVKQSFLLHMHPVIRILCSYWDTPQPRCDVAHAHVVNSYLSQRLFLF
jgi:hypothetical protein